MQYVSGCVGVQVCSTKIINGHGEGQVETCRADGPGAVKAGMRFGPRDQDA